MWGIGVCNGGTWKGTWGNVGGQVEGHREGHGCIGGHKGRWKDTVVLVQKGKGA